MLIHSKLDDFTAIQADKVCLIHGKIQLTYREFIQQIDTLAYQLATQIKKGDRVLVKLPSAVSQLLYFFAIIKAGGACVFIDSSTSDEVCANLMKIHQIHICIDETFQLPTTSALQLPKIQPQDIFLGALSSGSTGTPKLIWRDHQSWTNGFPIQSTVFTIGTSDVLFLTNSLIYTANLNACLHILFEGGTIILASTTLPRTWLQEIVTHQVTAIFMVPAHYKTLLKTIKHPLPQMKSIVTAGAKIDIQTVRNLKSAFPCSGIFEYYGASELGHVSYSTAEDLILHPSSVGKAFPGVTLTIEDQCIWATSPYLAPKYKPKATVGDLGRIDQDGYLYLLGRKQGIINAGGIKIIPEQVEAILLQCPGVTEAIVGGIDDPLRGQRVYAWVVKDKTNLLPTDILDFCRKNLRHHYCPHKIIVMDKMPINKSGKIDRIKLKDEVYFACD